MSDEPDFSTRVRCLVELYHAEENVQIHDNLGFGAQPNIYFHVVPGKISQLRKIFVLFAKWTEQNETHSEPNMLAKKNVRIAERKSELNP